MMKKIILLLFIALLGSTVQAQKINWMSFNEAATAQKKDPKPIFIDVFTDWCGPCKMLDRNTFSNSEVVKHINENYYAVKFNAEGNEKISFMDKTFSNPKYSSERRGRNSVHEFTYFLGVPAYPFMMVINSKGEVDKTITGYVAPEQLLSDIR